ncbi:PfkB family carbohydrate kinase [Anderseniella sp. Alg231-50]|uniref:PfkB family carbohydrate kinase n=1 Tax=Anderseniella sp. Alg231-50 TaxID=1922226 RepID=UPI000D55DDD7
MIFNFGSINVDHVYRVAEMPAPGETLVASSYQKLLGGKGINQSIAIARAGQVPVHVGAVGGDDHWTMEQVKNFGIDTSHIAQSADPTGHAVIYVDDAGENQIVIFGGANQDLKPVQIEKAFKACHGGDHWVLVQNETNLLADIVDQSKAAGFKVAYSAAPFVADTAAELIDKIDLLAVNEVEAEATARLLGVEVSEIAVPEILITKGSKGVEFHSHGERHHHPAFQVDAVDTTGAGDTFLGSFLAGHSQAAEIGQSLRYASAASALQVTRPGAAVAIPAREDVETFLKQQEA